MSKAIGIATSKMKNLTNATSKFTPTAANGNLRLDGGHFDQKTKEIDVVMQVNSQAKSPALVNWRNKNTTHAKLATEKFNTEAIDKEAELDRVLESLESQAKEKLR
ncbi:MAG: hypothetical protein Q9213_002876 [Squamulea squamosa]